MTEPVSPLSFSIGTDLVIESHSDLCSAIWSSAGFIVGGAEGSGQPVRSIDVTVALVDCNAQLLSCLNGSVCVDIMPASGEELDDTGTGSATLADTFYLRVDLGVLFADNGISGGGRTARRYRAIDAACAGATCSVPRRSSSNGAARRRISPARVSKRSTRICGPHGIRAWCIRGTSIGLPTWVVQRIVKTRRVRRPVWRTADGRVASASRARGGGRVPGLVPTEPPDAPPVEPLDAPPADPPELPPPPPLCASEAAGEINSATTSNLTGRYIDIANLLLFNKPWLNALFLVVR